MTRRSVTPNPRTNVSHLVTVSFSHLPTHHVPRVAPFRHVRILCALLGATAVLLQFSNEHNLPLLRHSESMPLPGLGGRLRHKWSVARSSCSSSSSSTSSLSCLTRARGNACMCRPSPTLLECEFLWPWVITNSAVLRRRLAMAFDGFALRRLSTVASIRASSKRWSSLPQPGAQHAFGAAPSVTGIACERTVLVL